MAAPGTSRVSYRFATPRERWVLTLAAVLVFFVQPVVSFYLNAVQHPSRVERKLAGFFSGDAPVETYVIMLGFQPCMVAACALCIRAIWRKQEEETSEESSLQAEVSKSPKHTCAAGIESS